MANWKLCSGKKQLPTKHDIQSFSEGEGGVILNQAAMA